MINNKDKKLFEELKSAGVISDGKVYRMRLFSEEERRRLRLALDATSSSAGMLDELEMVRWETYGRDKIRRTI